LPLQPHHKIWGKKKEKEKCKFKSKLPWLKITWKGELELTLTKEVLNYGCFVVEINQSVFSFGLLRRISNILG
jgi:hypothetical protein